MKSFCNAKVIEVIDGDTILVCIEEKVTSLFTTITLATTAKVRLKGIDTPEQDVQDTKKQKTSYEEAQESPCLQTRG